MVFGPRNIHENYQSRGKWGNWNGSPPKCFILWCPSEPTDVSNFKFFNKSLLPNLSPKPSYILHCTFPQCHFDSLYFCFHVRQHRHGSGGPTFTRTWRFGNILLMAVLGFVLNFYWVRVLIWLCRRLLSDCVGWDDIIEIVCHVNVYMNRFFCILSHVAEALFDLQCQEIFTHFFTFSRLKIALGKLKLILLEFIQLATLKQVIRPTLL